MPDEPRWLSADDLININRREVEAYNHIHGIRSRDLLESAAARPLNLFVYGQEDIAMLAAGLLAAVVRNHAFIDGNKRTGAMAAIVFLEINGYSAILPDDGRLAYATEALATGAITEEEVADLLAKIVGA